MSAEPRRGEYPLPEHAKPTSCRSCGAAIVWTRTEQGHRAPLDLATVVERDGIRYALNHFATCPHAREWSRHGGSAGPIQNPNAQRAPKIQNLEDRYRLADGTLPAAWWLIGRRNLSAPPAPTEQDIAHEAAQRAAEQGEEDL